MAKYIDAERLKAEIERRKADAKLYDMSGGDAPIYDELLSLLGSLQQKQQEEPDKSLEEAAKEYAEGPECTWVGTTALEEAFIAGWEAAMRSINTY